MERNFIGIIIGAILSGTGLYLYQSNEMTALKTEFKILKESSLDFKNNQKQLGEISVKQELLNAKDLKLTKLELSLKYDKIKINEENISLKIKKEKYNKLLNNLKKDKLNFNKLKQKLSLISRGENI